MKKQIHLLAFPKDMIAFIIVSVGILFVGAFIEIEIMKNFLCYKETWSILTFILGIVLLAIFLSFFLYAIIKKFSYVVCFDEEKIILKKLGVHIQEIQYEQIIKVIYYEFDYVNAPGKVYMKRPNLEILFPNCISGQKHINGLGKSIKIAVDKKRLKILKQYLPQQFDVKKSIID